MSQTLTPIDPALRHGPEAAPVQGSTPITTRVGRPLAWAGRGAATVAKRVAAIGVFLVLWQVAPKLGWVEEAFLPPFTTVLDALVDLARSGVLWTDISASLHRSLAGFAIAIAIGIPLGLLIAWYRTLSEILNPLLIIFLNTAAVALIPVFTLILGIGDFSKIMIIAYACFWTVLYNTISGARDVDPLLIRSARSLGLSSRKLFVKVILPAAAPAIFTGIRLAGAVSMLVLVTSEFVGAKAGLGYVIIASQNNFQIPQMYAGIVTISVIGLAFNYLLVLAERRFSRWRV
ncbi:ABC transporter permease [Flexivirga oryzae]|uniref:NitT/TauT family transport system permease protein n=1 Tax=Flexivirga oryzae TaxID=1794944 RepID=A0A839N5S0_9MICO|nr:ABC transporter permease [Flexivirga oryzae]MBB2890986.1 NitT/TauT family transport system permease protein [Flexivirga oryzae]